MGTRKMGTTGFNPKKKVIKNEATVFTSGYVTESILGPNPTKM